MIELKNIIKTYKIGKDQTFDALKGVSLDIMEGDFLSIMGPSGSGKSTLMNIIGMLDDATQGDYILKGEEINNLSDGEQTKIRGENIGFVFQNYSLIPRMKVLKQVMTPMIYAGVNRKQAKQRAINALAKVGLEDKLTSKPDELSGGQKQRVAIARAIVMEPALILADEPTGALDTKTGEEVMNIFSELNKEGKTIVVITHEPDIANLTKKIVTVKDGLLT
ncbi:MAG: ABC transporter ATP-binding protein [Candidatus Gracilibacteria bacterium]|nr:ABC transporter ATP-binding protein [Candidatus Gracilibacteria bacterium]